MKHFEILNPGILSLLQDAGRYGQHGIGLTTGGPMDPLAFKWANRLLGNDLTATAIETTVGGLKFKSHQRAQIAVTGATVKVTVNGLSMPQWQTLNLEPNDVVELGYATEGCRIYLAVAGGFVVDHQFGSTATVVRESIGGLDGERVKGGATLEIRQPPIQKIHKVPVAERPLYSNEITVRVIPGYQDHHFSRKQQRLFFHHQYLVSDRCDRMGYRLTGPKIHCDIKGILSEGICLGAIQVPADGQPIVLMNDRQTIGGYPKIGSAFSLDLAKLAQLMPGGFVIFEAITIDHAHNILALEQHKFESTEMEAVV